jgi:hypothetical protein
MLRRRTADGRGGVHKHRTDCQLDLLLSSVWDIGGHVLVAVVADDRIHSV